MSQPTTPEVLKILAIGAHPDDIELSCGGTLARYAQLGHSISIAVFTSGNMGDVRILPEDLAKLRKEEAKRAAELVGAKLIWTGIDDEFVIPNLEQRQIMIDLLRLVDPDVIITHSPRDYHPDHRYVSQLVFDSYFQKGLPHIPGQTQPACRFGKSQVYYMDNVGGIDFCPSEYVDISSVIDLKAEMLQCHASQVKAVAELAETNLVEMMMTQSRFRGFAAGCKFAEGFERLEAFQRGLTRRILP